jgi:hypothetical protein
MVEVVKHIQQAVVKLLDAEERERLYENLRKELSSSP